MSGTHRRKGLEQEFFLVDEAGLLSHRADEFLQRCRKVAQAEGRSPEYFAPEWVKHMIEINTPPVYTHLQPIGGLQPYAASTEELIELQFAHYRERGSLS